MQDTGLLKSEQNAAEVLLLPEIHPVGENQSSAGLDETAELPDDGAEVDGVAQHADTELVAFGERREC